MVRLFFTNAVFKVTHWDSFKMEQCPTCKCFQICRLQKATISYRPYVLTLGVLGFHSRMFGTMGPCQNGRYFADAFIIGITVFLSLNFPYYQKATILYQLYVITLGVLGFHSRMFSTMGPCQNGRYFADAYFNWNYCFFIIKIALKFIFEVP